MDIAQKKKMMHNLIFIIMGFVIFSSGLKEYIISTAFSFGKMQLWAATQVILLLLFSAALSIVSLKFKENRIKGKPFVKKICGFLTLELLVVCFAVLVAVCMGGLAVFGTALFPSLLSEGKIGRMIDIGYFLVVAIIAPLVIHLFVVYGYQTFSVRRALSFVWKTFHQVYWKLFLSVAAAIILVKGISLLQTVVSPAALPWLRVLITSAIWSLELLYLIFIYDSVDVTEPNI